MYQNIPSSIKLKIFVKETDGKETPEKLTTNGKFFPTAPLTGDKAKEFYEEVLKDASVMPVEKKTFVKSKSKNKPPVKKVQNKIFKNTDLLKMAQNNDVNNLQVFFDQMTEYDVNIVDEFGWTPLMCASCSGAKESVEILLGRGADPHKMDKMGNTALKLAQKNYQKNVIKILANYNNKKPEFCEDNESLVAPSEPFSCQTCKADFTMSKNRHESSTLHLFNSKFKTSTFYGIPESNKGFQLLLREGWDKEKGLGRDGSGRKFPVKAVMKKDRTGIGAPPPPEKSRDTRHTEKYESKKRRTYEKWKDKDFEKNFRLEFS